MKNTKESQDKTKKFGYLGPAIVSVVLKKRYACNNCKYKLRQLTDGCIGTIYLREWGNVARIISGDCSDVGCDIKHAL